MTQFFLTCALPNTLNNLQEMTLHLQSLSTRTMLLARDEIFDC